MKPGLIIDNFAGGGGASLGVEMACWKGPDIAINHDAIALGLHATNHPHTEHHVEDVWAVDPRAVTKGRPVSLAWFSPDCKHFSKAKGGKPVEKKIRGLAWVVIRWAVAVKPQLIVIENVEEFQDWGPLGPDNLPCPERKGRTFRLFVERLRQAGYEVDWRELKACDYGAPTIRKRLFLIARRDGLPIVWPEPTHAKPNSLEVGAGLRKTWRTAAECIDWTLPCPSIFGRARPLAEKTMARIARGVQRYVIDAERPFIINLTHGGRVEDIDEPFKTLTGAHRGEKALVAPFLARQFGQSVGSNLREPVGTVTPGGGGKAALVAPFFIPRHGEHATQEPRCRDVEQPMPTVTATANGAGLVAAFMAQHNGGMVGHSLEEPVSTLTAKCSHQQLVSTFLTKMYGSCKDGQDMRQPFGTVTAQGQHLAEVRAFLMKYYGTGGQHQGCDEPMHTATAKARLGLVTVAGVDYHIVDIGMRMLSPRELFRAQGFPDSYVIDRLPDGTPISKTDQIRLCGNSVCPPLARAIIAANFGNQVVREGGRVAA
jgi:DNA (cytosine-5)-methyltransferase 1